MSISDRRYSRQWIVENYYPVINLTGPAKDFMKHNEHAPVKETTNKPGEVTPPLARKPYPEV